MNNLKIAAALRALADAFETPAEAAPEQPPQDSATGTTAAPAARGRGRPPKAAATPAPAPVASPAAADPFEAAPATPAATLQDVRSALTTLKGVTSQEIALGVLKAAGDVDNLSTLPVGKYGVVVQAAIAAMPTPGGVLPVEADPFALPAQTPMAPAAKPLTLEDVKAAVVAAQKRTATDTVQKVVMEHGGKAAKPEGGEGPSLKALPPEAFAATIAAINSLPTTK